MKNFVVMLLCAVMLLGLAACTPGDTGSTTAATTEAATASFQVGYGKVAYSPKHSVQLAGYGQATERLCTMILDDVYVTCIAVTDSNDNTVLLYTCDSSSSGGQTTSQILRAVNKATGIPEENMFFSSTHTHSGPYNVAAAAELKEAAVEATNTALESRAPAQMYIGSTNTENLNFVRHYEMSDGSTVGDNHGVIAQGVTYVGHMTEADSEMQLIKFVREGQKDIVLMNWQAHPTLAATEEYNTYMSADFIGSCRSYIEEELDCEFAYFQGACGNLNGFSRISSENPIGRNHVKHGQALAQAAISAMDSLTLCQSGDVQILTQTYTATNDKDDAETMAAMVVFQDVLASGGTEDEAELATGGLINSSWEVISIGARAKAGETTDITVSAISIGDVSFIAAPYEMFDTNGMFIKKNTPFDMTFIMCYCNDGLGYIASDAAFDYGCYEVDTRSFVRGTAEDLADTYVAMLNELHAAQGE